MKCFRVGDRVRVLPPQSPNSQPDGFTGRIAYITAMYQPGRDAGWNYALAYHPDDHFDVIMHEQRLELAPAAVVEKLGPIRNTGTDFLDRIEKAVRS